MTQPPLAFPSLAELLSAARVVALPMRTRFRGQVLREAMLFEGPCGWAEFSPFPEYQAQEASLWLEAGIRAAWSGLGTPERLSIPVNATLPAVDVAEVEQVLTRYGNLDAVRSVKIKVAEPGYSSFAESLAADVARLRETQRILPHAGLRADANGAWTHEQALAATEAFAEVAGGNLEYLEQPVSGVEPLADLREEIHRRGITVGSQPVRIAADEAVRKVSDPLRVAQLGAADLIVVKVPPLGGVDRAEQIVTQSGLDAVVSSALDTSIGLTAGLALAARLPKLPYACGLGTATLFASDVVDSPLTPQDGHIEVPLKAGRIAAPEPNNALLTGLSVESDGAQWWQQRVRAAYPLIEERLSR